MKTIIGTLLLMLLLFNFDGNCQPQQPNLTFQSRSSFVIEDIDGVSVYRWKHNNQKVTGEVHILRNQDFSTSTVYHDEMKGKLVNGLQQGKWIYGSPNMAGKINEVNYDKGLIVGDYIVRARIDSVIVYKEGHTVKNRWVSRDTIYYKTFFTEGDGLWTDFHGNGTIKEEGTLKAGRKHGEWRYYTRIGNFLFRKRYYEDGILVKQEDYKIPEENAEPVRC